MSFAEDLLPVLASARGIGGELGLRPHSVAVITSDESANTHTGDGSESLTTTALLEDGQNPKVRWLTDEQQALSQDAAPGTVRVGPLTPDHEIGGVALSTLTGTSLAVGDTLDLLITGPKHPNGQRYTIKRITADSALHYVLECAPG